MLHLSLNSKYSNFSNLFRAVGCLLYELASLRPPFDAQNQLSLAMKITAGRFHRIPNKYSDDLQNAIRFIIITVITYYNLLLLLFIIYCFYRSMLQVDPLKRPRIEDLMNLPSIQVI